MKEYEVTLTTIKFAYLNGRLSLDEALDCAQASLRTGIPDEYHEALGVE